MANLKLIKVTGSPFCSIFYGCIGIRATDNQFQIIKNGILNTQSSFSGTGWEYATAEEIKENWAVIYPHWTPEVGDNVIVVQDFQQWTNSRGTIIEKDPTSDYYRVESETGRSCIFDYTRQMILAPYSESKVETTIEPEETATTRFKVGDRVKCIGITIRGYGKVGTVRQIGDSVGVEFDENVDGHTLNGLCENGYGWWIRSSDLELVTESKPKEKTVSIRFLTEQQFKDQSLWIDGHPRGWNYDGLMNKYLGQSIVIPKSNIGSDGSFRYEYWTFKETDYIVTEWIPSKVDDFKDVSRTIASSGITFKSVVTPIAKPEKPPRRFKVGDKVTYKSRAECNGSYNYGGEDQTGFVGIVESEMSYESDKGCYGLRVTTKGGDYCYSMLESEFKEYDSGYVDITSGAIGSSQPATRLVIKGSSAAVDTDPLSLYKQKPITIKQKPKTKLTII